MSAYLSFGMRACNFHAPVSKVMNHMVACREFWHSGQFMLLLQRESESKNRPCHPVELSDRDPGASGLVVFSACRAVLLGKRLLFRGPRDEPGHVAIP